MLLLIIAEQLFLRPVFRFPGIFQQVPISDYPDNFSTRYFFHKSIWGEGFVEITIIVRL